MLSKLFLEKKSNKKINIIITIVYFLIHLYVVLNHEHWADEAQAYVLAKNLNIFELFNILCTEGHPCLWFLYIMPFAKLGFNYNYFSLISLITMTIAVYLLLSYSPFSSLVNIAILFSSLFLFYNPVVFRSYCLIALLIILICVFYKHRFNKPVVYGVLLFLLFQTHVLSFGLAIGLTIGLLLDYLNSKNKKLLTPLLLSITSFILAILELYPREGHASGVDQSVSGILSKLNIDNIIKGLSYFSLTSWGLANKSIVLVLYVMFICLIVLLFVFVFKNKTIKNNLNIIITAICGFGVFFGVVILVYVPHAQMSSILVGIIVFVMWQIYDSNKELNIKLVSLSFILLTSLLTFIPSQSSLRLDIRAKYSESKDVANLVINDIKYDGILLMENSVYNSSVYSYIQASRKDVDIYDLQNKEIYKFHRWGTSYIPATLGDINNGLNIYTGSNRDIYILVNSKMDINGFKLVFTNENNNNRMWNEIYYLYGRE